MRLTWLLAVPVLVLTSVAEAGDLRASGLQAAVDAPEARDAIARVTYAEAGGQGDSGLAGVVYTILNRLAAGTWGGSVEAVVDARGQFEPVMRAGGDWRNLKPRSPAERARVDTILNLAFEGRLPDPTGGALYFQNPKIVAARAAAGTVSASLVDFGGAAPTARIGDHAFYASRARGGGRSNSPPLGSARGLFVLADGRVVEDTAAPPPP